MNIKPINTQQEYLLALKQVDALWDASPKTQEHDELHMLSTMVAAYEDVHFPIAKPEPAEAVKFRVDQTIGIRQ